VVLLHNEAMARRRAVNRGVNRGVGLAGGLRGGVEVSFGLVRAELF
jgi:hypothetical protein